MLCLLDGAAARLHFRCISDSGTALTSITEYVSSCDRVSKMINLRGGKALRTVGGLRASLIPRFCFISDSVLN